MSSAPAIDRSRVERQEPSEGSPHDELGRRSAMLHAVASAATRMVAGVDWREEVDRLLEELANATAMSRVTLFETHIGPQGYLVQSCRFDWADPGLARLSSDPRYQNMELSDEGPPGSLGEWSRLRQRGDIVQATLREVTGYTRKVFLEHGTLAFLSVPVMAGGQWWGFLGFDDCRTERVWSDAEIDVLKTAAALIAGAIERERASERIRLSEERYALAARGANDGLWDWDLASGSAYFSPRVCEILNVGESDLGRRMDRLFDLLASPDAVRLRAELDRCFAKRAQKFESECRLCGPAPERWIIIRGLIVYGADGPRRAVGSLHDITRRKRVQDELQESERRRARLSRYFSPNMIDVLIRSGAGFGEPRRQTISVLFADIWGFSRIGARLAPEKTFALLREYLGLVETAVFAHGGTLDKFLGDGLMATFGTPTPTGADAGNALRCAAAMAARVEAWNRRRSDEGQTPMRIGIGVHRGEVVLGDIGSDQRMEFAVIGDTVNIASRVQEMTRTLDIAILATGPAVLSAQEEGGLDALKGFRTLGSHPLRGRGGTIELWGKPAREG